MLSIVILKIAASIGSGAARFALAKRYANGDGVNKDDVESIKWLLKAANCGHTDAQYCLGDYCKKGEKGFQKSASRAVEWYRKAADQGHPDAQFTLGVCYEKGEGVRGSAPLAVAWYQKAARQGHADAQYNLGMHYQRGAGIERDPAQAMIWLKKAAEPRRGDARKSTPTSFDRNLHSNLTNQLRDSASNGRPPESISFRTVEQYREAADQGDADAQFNLGVCYEKGEGVRESAPLAVAWYQKAARQGHADAQYCLGMHYMRGVGIERDPAQAMFWFKKAAAQGHAGALYNLKKWPEKEVGVENNVARTGDGDTEADGDLQSVRGKSKVIEASRQADLTEPLGNSASDKRPTGTVHAPPSEDFGNVGRLNQPFPSVGLVQTTSTQAGRFRCGEKCALEHEEKEEEISFSPIINSCGPADGVTYQDNGAVDDRLLDPVVESPRAEIAVPEQALKEVSDLSWDDDSEGDEEEPREPAHNGADSEDGGEFEDDLADEDWGHFEGDWGEGADELSADTSSRAEVEADWKTAGVAPEFDGKARHTAVSEVAAAGRVSRRIRALQVALELGEEFGWDREDVEFLTDVFHDHGGAKTRAAIERELEDGLTPDELRLAVEVRRIWGEYPEFSQVVSRGGYGGEQDEAIIQRGPLSWSGALQIVRSFSGYPDEDEIERLLRDIHDDWYSTDSVRRSFWSFRSYLLHRLGQDEFIK